MKLAVDIAWQFVGAGLLSWMLGCSSFAEVDAQQQQPNLLTNASFEKGTEGWEMHPGPPQATATRDLDQPHAGHPSMRIDNLVANATSFCQPVALKPSTRYRLSGWIKATKIVKAEGQRNGDFGAGLAVLGGYDTTNWVSDTKDWVHVSLDFTTKTKTDLKVGPWLGHYGKQVTGTAWFADISLVELGPAPVTANSAAPAKPANTPTTSPAIPPQPGSSPAAITPAGFAAIFDKDHSDGWKYMGEGEMVVRDGVASTSAQKPPQDGLYWYQKTSFADFTLKLEFKADSTNANSGVLIRFPDPGNDYKVATDKGSEIDIFGKNTGSIIFHANTIRPAEDLPFLLGAWNEFEIVAVGQKITVLLNGQVVNESTVAGALTGYIGLQTNVGDGPVHFRNVRIKAGTPPVSTPEIAGAPWQRTSWVSDVSLPAGTYQAANRKIEIAKGRKVNASQDCLVEGGTFNSAGGAVWDVRESVFRGSHFEENLGAKFYATSCLFEGVEMNKTGGWFSDRWSTRWIFENCVFSGKFTRSELGVTDYSVRANRCTFRNLTLPRLKYKKDPADEAQSNDLRFSDCRFIRCEVPESFLASTVDGVFEECRFSSKREDWKKAGRPINVTGYITGPGAPPASYENGNLKVTFKSTEPPENGTTLTYGFTNGHLSLPTIRTQGKELELGIVDSKSSSSATAR